MESNESTPTLGVAVVEDSAMLGELIEEAIESHPKLHLTARVGSIRAAYTSVPWNETQLASIDLHLPDGLGISLGRRIRASHPRTRILILSDHRRPSLLRGIDPEDLPHWSYILKSSIEGRQQLGDALYRAATESYIDPRIETGASDAEVVIAGLSEQQRRVLALVSRGLSNSAIAKQMNIADKSVEYHLTQIYQRLGLIGDSEANQRVMAAVTYLQQYAPRTHI